MTDQEETLFKEYLPVWEALSSDQQATLLAATGRKEFPKGTLIHGGNDDCSGLFLVRSGQVRVFIVSEAGKEITLYHLFERDLCIFSAACVFRDIAFNVLVEATQPTTAFYIPAEIFKPIQADSAAVANAMNQLMSARFSDVMWLMEQILFMSFDKRLAIFLLEQSARDGSDRLEITHETIARHLGSAREVVTRMLKYFAAEGMVELFRGGVIIKNRRKLQKNAD